MSMDSDQLLADRFARLAPKPTPPTGPMCCAVPGGWDRRRSGRAPRRALLVAAVLVGLFALAGGALALSGVGTGVPAIDRLLDGATRDFADVPRGSAAAPVPAAARGA